MKNKKGLRWILIFGMLAPASRCGAFQLDYRLKRSFEVVSFSFKPWLSQGSSLFKTAAPFSGDRPRTEIGLGETASFQGVDKFIPVVSAEIRPLRWFSFDVEYGNSSFGRGNNYDHYWLDAPTYRVTFLGSGNVYSNPVEQDLALVAASLTSRTSVFNTNLYFNVLSAKANSDYDNLEFHEFMDVFIGYTWYNEKYRLTNGQVLVRGVDRVLTPPAGPLPGLDSAFELNWQAVKVGIREEVTLPYDFFAIGKFAYAPAARYRGNGYYNLRLDLKDTNPQFLQAGEGTLIDFLISLGLTLHKRVLAELGYQAYYFYAKKGDELKFQADQSILRDDVERARAVRQGFYLNLSLKY